ncbi:unnamed protein product [Adineta steineri]|uniref:Uncharacterized protein n=1 Tax=Adineta steineri TaxID=433720 RepID=A0A819QAT0_9BILA|nr:unnamed protein product [Adineta steineri]CAF4021809.1 unnamed protein product [Adineta steineri]
MKTTLFLVLFVFYSSVEGLKINYYPSLGQIIDEGNLKNNVFEAYFDANDYSNIIQGSIDYPGTPIVEQNLYSSNEYHRNAPVHVRASSECSFSKAHLVDPYSLLVKDGSKFFYTEQKNIQFENEPYLNAGTLRALADIANNHQRAYHVSNSSLTSGTVNLAGGSSVAPVAHASVSMLAMAPVATTPTASNYGTYTYQINEAYTLYPQSVKTFPFITPTIVFAYTLEATSYVPSGGSSNGLFQRMFHIKPSEFLPAGQVTFYQNQMVLGQASIADTAKNVNTTVTLSTDPDIQYKIESIVTATRQSPSGQDLSVNVTITNRKDKQIVTIKLTLNGGYQSTTLTTKNVTSGLTITQDRLKNSTLIIEATIKPGKEETASFNLKQSNST